MDLFGLDALLRFFLRNLGWMNLTTGQGVRKRGWSEVSKGSRSSSRSRSGSESADSGGSNASYESTESQRSQAYQGEMNVCMSRGGWCNSFTQRKIEEFRKAANTFGKGENVQWRWRRRWTRASWWYVFFLFFVGEKEENCSEGPLQWERTKPKIHFLRWHNVGSTPKTAIEETSKTHGFAFLLAWQKTFFPFGTDLGLDLSGITLATRVEHTLLNWRWLWKSSWEGSSGFVRIMWRRPSRSGA